MDLVRSKGKMPSGVNMYLLFLDILRAEWKQHARAKDKLSARAIEGVAEALKEKLSPVLQAQRRKLKREENAN